MNPLPAILDWLYPPTCIACRVILPLNQPARFICARCVFLFEQITAPTCNQCGSPVETEVPRCSSCYGKTFHFTYNRGAFPYDELIRDLMHEIKFRNKKRVAVGLGKLWADTLAEDDSFLLHMYEHDFTLVPLPMHKAKQRERGFNQAVVMAEELSQKLNIPMEEILLRTEDTPPQAGLHPKLRAENVRDVFAVRPDTGIREKNYILVDDIYTTGASLNECARTLKNAGANEIICITFAITEKNNDKV